MYAPAGLGLGHALYAVDAGLVLQAGVGARTLDDEAYLLDAPSSVSFTFAMETFQRLDSAYILYMR